MHKVIDDAVIDIEYEEISKSIIVNSQLEWS